YITPLLANLTTTDTIVGATFRANFKAYYDARTDLLNAIAAKAKTLADAAQSTADVGSAHAATAHAPSDADHTQTTIDGGLVTTGTLQVVQGGTVAAGITGNTAGDTAVRFFAGSTFANRASAPFRVLQNGAIHATSATISGTITSGSGSKIAGFTATTTDLTSGSGSTAIGISTDTEKKAFWAGSTKPASAPFYVAHNGTGRMGLFSFTSSNLTASYEDDYWDNNLVISGLEDSDYEWINATSLYKSTGNLNSIRINPSGIYHGLSDSDDNVQYDVNTFGTGSTVNQSVITIRALIGDKYAFRCNGNAYFFYNVSALSFTDRTEMPENMDEALEIINTMQPTKGKVDYKRLSNKAKKFTVHKADDGSEYIEEGRDLTKTVSALIMVCQKLQEENIRLSDRLAALENRDTDEEQEYIKTVEKVIESNRESIRERAGGKK
ncbi:MAG TPA: hypothetical protein PLK58_12555, partial [Candidatus Rifleibacterium sp.]|nr:hypothetical protein [Candidatus Rifleibacterium sp.]